MSAFLMTRRHFFLGFGLALFLSACSSTAPYVYRFVPGRTATMENGRAVAPSGAPAEVHQAVAAANQIAGMPYRYGGGHRSFYENGYDCSGATSFVLHHAGLLSAPTTSTALRTFGKRGAGRWMTIYGSRGHVFLVIAGLRFDTGYGGGPGPHWSTQSRPADGYVLRHPRQL